VVSILILFPLFAIVVVDTGCNLPLGLLTPAELVAKFAVGGVDTGGNFAADVVNTGDTFAAGVIDTGGAP
jgi:hypothetical protein